MERTENFPKNDNLKYTKRLRQRAKNTEKTVYTYKICTATPDTNDRFTWTKNKTFILN